MGFSKTSFSLFCIFITLPLFYQICEAQNSAPRLSQRPQRASWTSRTLSTTLTPGRATATSSTLADLMARTLPKAAAAVNLWVAEKLCYSCKGGQQCLHYTQVGWKNSVRDGCARVHCSNGWWIVSRNYDPPGNYVGQQLSVLINRS